MVQTSIPLTNKLAQALAELMQLRHLRNEEDALEAAVQETLERERRRTKKPDFSRWIGLANRAPANLSPRFRSDDDLWS
jgi:hypothetical protein